MASVEKRKQTVNQLKPNCQTINLSFTTKLPYSQLVMQQKCLQQRCLWRKYKNPNIDI